MYAVFIPREYGFGCSCVQAKRGINAVRYLPYPEPSGRHAKVLDAGRVAVQAVLGHPEIRQRRGIRYRRHGRVIRVRHLDVIRAVRHIAVVVKQRQVVRIPAGGIFPRLRVMIVPGRVLGSAPVPGDRHDTRVRIDREVVGI